MTTRTEVTDDRMASNPKTISKDKALELLELAMHLLNEVHCDDNTFTPRQENDFWKLINQLPQNMATSVIN